MLSLISVIIPIYNAEKYLKECLDTVLHQTYKNLQIILINDGSTDSSGSICNNYAKKDNRITVLHKRNGGVSTSRNEGIRLALGEYILFLDSDDYADPNMCEMLYNYISLNKVDMVITGTKLTRRTGKTFLDRSELYKHLAIKNIDGSCWGRIFKKSIIESNSLEFDECGQCGEDLFFNLQYFAHISSAMLIDIQLVYYRYNPDSISNSGGIKQRETWPYIYHRIVEEYEKHSPENLHLTVFIYVSGTLDSAKAYANQNSQSEAQKLLSDARKHILKLILAKEAGIQRIKMILKVLFYKQYRHYINFRSIIKT